MKRSLGAKTLICPTPDLDRRIVRQAGQAQRHDGGLGRHLLLRSALRGRLAAQGHLQLRQPDGAAGLHRQRARPRARSRRPITSGSSAAATRDKFAATGLTPVRSDLVDAPYVAEFPLVLECKVLHIFELGLHTQFVGQILDVKADEEVLDAAGMPDILKVLPIIFSPGNRVYYGVGASLGHAFAVGKEI